MVLVECPTENDHTTIVNDAWQAGVQRSFSPTAGFQGIVEKFLVLISQNWKGNCRMKILLISPPNYRFRNIAYQNIPFGPAYLAAVLGKHHDVLCYNAEVPSKDELDRFEHDYTSYEFLMNSHGKFLEGLLDESHPIWNEIESAICSYSPDIIGISTMTPSYPAALTIARIAKKVSRALVIFGGVHATVLSHEVASSKFVDFVIRGEGERTIIDLLNCIEKGTDPRNVSGITYKKDGKIISTPDRELIKNLDTIPFPDKTSLLFPERYPAARHNSIIVGRGCTSRCHFCSNHILWGKRYRLRSSENVFEELKLLCEDNGEPIRFTDDNLMISRKLLFELCEQMTNETPEIIWNCQSRVDTLTREMVAIAKRAGCWDIKLGLESGSDKILRYINKRLTVREIMECCEMILKTGMSFSVNFMFGFPDETLQDMRRTLDLIKKVPADNIAISKFIPLPGTKLFDDVVNLGLIQDDPPKYEHLDLYSTYYHYPRHVSIENFQEIFQEIFQVVDEKNKKTRKGAPQGAQKYGKNDGKTEKDRDN